LLPPNRNAPFGLLGAGAGTGVSFGADDPVVEARTHRGFEVRAVHQTTAADGPVVSITLPSKRATAWSLEELLERRVIDPVIANLLSACVQGGLDIAVCAGPGASSFPILAALAEAAPSEHRLVIVGPGFEPGPVARHAVVLRPSERLATEGATAMQSTVRAALALAPDRLVVHDVAGPEAADGLTAMGRGLQGTIVSVRAASAFEGLHRLATLCGLAGGAADGSTRALHVAQSVGVFVTLARFADGHTRLTAVSEARVNAEGTPEIADVITFDPRSGSWTLTGVVPSFFSDLEHRGVGIDVEMLTG